MIAVTRAAYWGSPFVPESFGPLTCPSVVRPDEFRSSGRSHLPRAGDAPAHLLHRARARAVLSAQPYLRDDDRVSETYWTTSRGVEAGATSYHLLDRTVYGRQETWEDSPAGWPQPYATTVEQFRTDGRPTAQWARLAEDRSDDLSG